MILCWELLSGGTKRDCMGRPLAGSAQLAHCFVLGQTVCLPHATSTAVFLVASWVSRRKLIPEPCYTN